LQFKENFHRWINFIDSTEQKLKFESLQGNAATFSAVIAFISFRFSGHLWYFNQCCGLRQ